MSTACTVVSLTAADVPGTEVVYDRLRPDEVRVNVGPALVLVVADEHIARHLAETLTAAARRADELAAERVIA